MAAGTFSIVAALYNVGANLVGSRTFVARTINTGSIVVDGSAFLDPTAEVEAVLELQVGGIWQQALAATQFGSPTGTWATKQGSSTNCFNMEVVYSGGLVITGVRLTFNVSGSPVTLGPITVSWN